jgi:acyl transferase domain-containing protein
MVKVTDAKTLDLVLLPFSAHDEQSLAMNIAALSEAVASHSSADVAYTLSAGRSRMRHRSFRIMNIQKPEESLSTPQIVQQASTSLNKIGFVFTGQGAQWYASKCPCTPYFVFRSR